MPGRRFSFSSRGRGAAGVLRGGRLMTCPPLRLHQPEQSEGDGGSLPFSVTQTSDAKSSVDDLGAGRGVVHGRAVPNSHCDLLRLSPSNKTGRFVLPEQAGRIAELFFLFFSLMYIYILFFILKKKNKKTRRGRQSLRFKPTPAE